MALPPLPPFPQKDSAWLWIPYRTSSAVNQLIVGVVLAAGATFNAVRAHTAGMRGLHVVLAVVGALIALPGLKLVLRRGPAIAADADGITASMTGLDRSRVPWDLITGAALVGKNKHERAIVILTADPAACAKIISPTMVGHVNKANRTNGVSGAYYVMAKTMAEPLESVVSQINELAASLHADPAGPVTSPGGTSQSSRPV